MRVYITAIPEKGDDLEIAVVLTFAESLMKDGVPTRLVITNMKRENPGFKKASEM